MTLRLSGLHSPEWGETESQLWAVDSFARFPNYFSMSIRPRKLQAHVGNGINNSANQIQNMALQLEQERNVNRSVKYLLLAIDKERD